MNNLLIESAPHAAPGHPPVLDDALQAALWQALTETLACLRRPAAAGAPRATLNVRAPAHTMPVPLSARERQVLARIAAGDSNKLIARTLGLSLHTVKRHVANILDKLNAGSRGQAAAWWQANRPAQG
jgi:LuxR family maltose regulon positive regulatory protein